MILLHDNLLKKLQLVEGPNYKEVIWSTGVIYGMGGWNRYFVNREIRGEKKWEEYEVDEVVFSAFHSDEKGIKKAKEAGFRIFY
jgi:hypothetical protein